jgi:hypothetical protein
METIALSDHSVCNRIDAQHLVAPSARGYGSEDRLAAGRQPTDQYDGALGNIDHHIGAAQ